MANEVDAFLGHAIVEGLLDMAEFYDTIDLAELCKGARNMD